jgi:hypothetical protein
MPKGTVVVNHLNILFSMAEAAAGRKAAAEATGATGPKYAWSQTLGEVSIFIPLPAGATSKMLDIVVLRQSIKVAIKGGQTIFSGPLVSTVHPDECFWTFEKGQVEVTLSKVAILKCIYHKVR